MVVEESICFVENERAILLSTDVAARGLDIPHIQHVIHYNVPKTAEVREILLIGLFGVRHLADLRASLRSHSAC